LLTDSAHDVKAGSLRSRDMLAAGDLRPDGIFTIWREYALRHRVPVQAASAGCDKELATPLIRVAPPDVQE
jgi:hypothetical protein